MSEENESIPNKQEPSQANQKPKSKPIASLILGKPEIPDSIEIGRRYHLSTPTVFISNQKDATIPLSGDNNYAVLLTQDEEGWFFENQGEPGTVWLNGFPNEERRLKEGDLLTIGGTIFYFLEGTGVLSDIYNQMSLATRVDLHTGAYNKAHFWISLEDWINLRNRHYQALSLMVVDIDKFKQVNDDYGHLAGDAVLRQTADRITKRLRRGDIFCRFGGEEFTLILPETTLDNALSFAEEIREAMASQLFVYKDMNIPVTVSIGVAEYQEKMSKEAFLEIADDHVYTAKRTGRNKVVG